MADATKKDGGAPTLLGVGPAPAPKGDGASDGAFAMPVIGTILGQRFQLEVVLGRGGSGVVYRAFDRIMGEPVAVKVLYPERAAKDGWIRRLVREVRVARSIRHLNVCRIFEIAQADGYWLITMELGVGTLGDELLQPSSAGAQTPPLGPWRERREDARAVCDGLAAIHASGISHRDVTPQNVLRLADGRLVLSDFGLALPDGEKTAFVAATPNYAAPEVLGGVSAGVRSDVWQLGLVLHQIVFGQWPRWQRNGDEKILQRPLGIDDETPTDQLMRVLGACLRTEPERRPGTAVAIAQALEALRPGRVSSGTSMNLRQWASRAGTAAALLALAAVAVMRLPTMRRAARPTPIALAAPEPTATVPLVAPATPSAPPPLAAPPPPPVTTATRIRIHIESRPAHARVVDDVTGTMWGFTPLDTDRDAGAGAIRLRVAKAGFEPTTLTLDGSISASEFLALHPLDRRRRRSSDPAIEDARLLPLSMPLEPAKL